MGCRLTVGVEVYRAGVNNGEFVTEQDEKILKNKNKFKMDQRLKCKTQNYKTRKKHMQ